MTAADKGDAAISTSVRPELDPISPELVMVDPAIAAEARAQLPLPGSFASRPAVEEPRLAPTVVARPVEPEPARQPRRRWRRRAAGVVVLAGVAGALAALGYVLVGDRSSSQAVSEQPARSITAPPRTTAPVTTPPATAPSTHTIAPPTTKAPPRPATTTKAPTPPAAPTHTVPATPPPVATTPKPKPKPKPAPVVPKPPKAQPDPSFVPARTWTWAPVAGATAYRVLFIRDSAAFYSATTSEPRLELPARVKFLRGRYAWSVVPIVDGRPAEAVVRSTFTIR